MASTANTGSTGKMRVHSIRPLGRPDRPGGSTSREDAWIPGESSAFAIVFFDVLSVIGSLRLN